MTEEQKIRYAQAKVDWKTNNPRAYLWSTVKYRAKKESIPFNLDIEDIVIPTHCPYLGIELTTEKGNGHADNLMSVDKIVPSLGYVKGNVEVISYKANRMKNDASIKELIVFARSVIERYDKNPLP